MALTKKQSGGPDLSAEWLEIGYISRAHGLRGEVKLKLHNPEGSSLFEVKSLLLRNERLTDRRFEIESVRGTAPEYVVALKNVASREQADEIKSCQVWVERAELEPLADDEYFVSDLVGFTVRCPDGIIGVVERIALHPSVEAVVIRTPEGELLEQVLIDEWIDSVELAEKQLILHSRDGLI